LVAHVIRDRVVLASSNTHKLGEIRAIFEQLRSRSRPDATSHTSDTWELVGLDTLEKHIPEPVEDQPDFEGNAILKARYYADATGYCCLADDSGLEVEALGNAPGIYSARYAQRHAALNDPLDNGQSYANNEANICLMMEQLGDTPIEKRTARFVCAMALCAPNVTQPLATVCGIMPGRILGPGDDGYRPDARCGRGTNGFCYDPVFVVAELGLTAAELSPQQKNQVSHRGNATRLMWEAMLNLPNE
jgi:XTP/dITP diphosphohydrolase